MTNKWRPEGWQNPIPVLKPIPKEIPLGSAYQGHLLFEAGADAMLEALRAKGIPDAYWRENTAKPEYKGVWVFIPDAWNG